MDAFARTIRVAVMVALDTISQLLYIVGTADVLRISERLWTIHAHKGAGSWRGVLCLASEPALKFKCGCRCTLKLDLEIEVGIKNQVRAPMDRKTQAWNPHRNEIKVNTAFKKQAETSNSELTFKMACKCLKTLKPDLQVRIDIEKSLCHNSYREYSIKDQT